MGTKFKKKRTSSSRPLEQAIKGKVFPFLKSSNLDLVSKRSSLILKSPVVKIQYSKKKKIDRDNFYHGGATDCPAENIWLWALKIVINNSESILDYLDDEQLLTEFLIRKDYKKAEEKAVECIERFGHSIKISTTYYKILQNSGQNIESNKIKVSDPVLKIILQKSLDRVNNSDGLYEYKSERLLNEITNSSLSDVIKEILTYQIFPSDPHIKIDYTTVLRYEINSTYIDLHELLTTALRYSDNIEPALSMALLRLSNEELKTLKSITGYSLDNIIEITKQDIEYTKILDHCVEGRNIDKSNTEILNLTLEAATLSNIIYSELDLPNSKISRDILDNIKKIIHRAQDDKSARENLLSLSYDYRKIPWFKSLWFIVNQEDKYITEKSKRLYRTILLKNSANTPEKIEILPHAKKNDLIKKLSTAIKNSTSIYYYSQLHLDNKIEKIENRLDGFHKGYCRAFSSITSGDYKKAEIISREISFQNTGRKKQSINSLYIKSLLHQKKFEEASISFVDSYLENSSQADYSDLTRIVESIGTAYINSKIVEYPILLSIYSENINDDKDTDLEASFEAFLELNDLDLPLDLLNRSDDFNLRKTNYFLKNVCKPRTIESLVSISNQQEAKSYRIKICQYLKDNSEHSDQISNELVDLMRQNLLKKLKKQVDSSKIYFDPSVFLGAHSQTYRTLFNRYAAIRSSYNSPDDPCYHLYKSIENKDEDIFKIARGVVLIERSTGNEDLEKRTNLFFSLVTLVRDIFINSEKGLNNYISTRIRHGHLPTELRNPLVDENLYIATDKRFADWSSGSDYQNISREQRDLLYKKVKAFSRDYDSIINRVNNEYLQFEVLSKVELALSRDESKRLFSYHITRFECYILEQKMSPTPSYEEFVKTTLEFLWKKTEYNLENIRRVIKGEVQNSFLEILNKLKSEVDIIQLPRHIENDLINKIDRTISKINPTIELVSKWFTLYKDSDYSDCNIEDIIDISSSSSGINVSISETCKNLQVKGEFISYLVDFTTIIIENSISKSGVHKSQVDLNFKFSETSNGGVQITASNICSPDVLLNNEYKFYEEAYGMEDLTKDAIQQEGGSGFFKIWNLLYKVLGIPHSVKMKKEDSRFTVTFLLEKSDVLKWI